jgi:hypothetical protein
VIEYHERQAIDYKGFWKVEMKIAIIYASTHHGNTKQTFAGQYVSLRGYIHSSKVPLLNIQNRKLALNDIK